MARILDETFRSTGYNETWTETVNAGCSLNENFPTGSFTAGTTPSVNWHKFSLLIKTDGDASDACAIQRFNFGYIPILYTRFEFMIVSANPVTCASINLCILQGTAAANNLIVHNLAFNAAANELKLQSSIADCSAATIVYTALLTPYVTYNVESMWDITNENAEIRFNGSTVVSVPITAVVGLTRTCDRFLFGNNNRTGAFTLYFDNITMRTDTWPNDVGSGYDDPIREIDYLSTQRNIGMSL